MPSKMVSVQTHFDAALRNQRFSFDRLVIEYDLGTPRDIRAKHARVSFSDVALPQSTVPCTSFLGFFSLREVFAEMTVMRFLNDSRSRSKQRSRPGNIDDMIEVLGRFRLQLQGEKLVCVNTNIFGEEGIRPVLFSWEHDTFQGSVIRDQRLPKGSRVLIAG